MSAATLAKLSALADVTEATRGLTPSELRRAAAYMRSLRASRTDQDRAPLEAVCWADAVVPWLRVAGHAVDAAETLCLVVGELEDSATDPDHTPQEQAVYGALYHELRPLVDALTGSRGGADLPALTETLADLAAADPLH